MQLWLQWYYVTVCNYCTQGEAAAVDKKALEDRIITFSRSALKPHYHGGRITAQEYKTIMKRAITKVCGLYKSQMYDFNSRNVPGMVEQYILCGIIQKVLVDNFDGLPAASWGLRWT